MYEISLAATASWFPQRGELADGPDTLQTRGLFMKINHDTSSLSLVSDPLLKPQAFLSGFQTIAPRFRKSQEEALDWLGEAHAVLGQANRALVKALFARYSASADRVAPIYGHELADFAHHRDWDAMRLFPLSSTWRLNHSREKAAILSEAVTSVFERFYTAKDLKRRKRLFTSLAQGTVLPAARSGLSPHASGAVKHRSFMPASWAATPPHPALHISLKDKWLLRLPLDPSISCTRSSAALHLDPDAS